MGRLLPALGSAILRTAPNDLSLTVTQGFRSQAFIKIFSVSFADLHSQIVKSHENAKEIHHGDVEREAL